MWGCHTMTQPKHETDRDIATFQVPYRTYLKVSRKVGRYLVLSQHESPEQKNLPPHLNANAPEPKDQTPAAYS